MSHTSYEELFDKLKKARELVEIGSIYYHYKSWNNHYEIIDIAMLEANEEPAVIYKPLYIDSEKSFNWIRPLSDFVAEVEVDGKIMKRFTKLS